MRIRRPRRKFALPPKRFAFQRDILSRFARKSTAIFLAKRNYTCPRLSTYNGTCIWNPNESRVPYEIIYQVFLGPAPASALNGANELRVRPLRRRDPETALSGEAVFTPDTTSTDATSHEEERSTPP
jgi:hypothetical protein